jgi:cytoskeletal protein CcmA (bactofilin family)
MKFFDPKKKETPPQNNPASTQRPSYAQNPTPPVSNPQPQPAPAAQQPVHAPQQQKVEAVKPEPSKMEPPKPEPMKSEAPKPQPASAPPTISIPAPDLPKSAPVVTEPVPAKVTGKTLIGNSVIIRGEITSEENLQIEGVVDGSIEANNDVVIGHQGRVNATIRAVNIVIQGRVIGDVTASNRVELAPSALLQGNIRSPKLSIAETAKFKGSVDMRPAEPSPAKDSKEKNENPAKLETVEK